MYRVKYEDLESADIISNVVYESGGGGFAYEPLHLLFKIENFRAVGTQSGIRRSMVELKSFKEKEEAYVVLINTKKIEEWQNHYDSKTNILTYYGDNRTSGNDLLNTKQSGNITFKKLFERGYGNKENREKLSPIFYFERTGASSDMRFIGLALPFVEGLSKEQALERKTFTTNNGEFENYVAKFTIIPNLHIKRDWLKDLKLNRKHFSSFAPSQWLEFIERGVTNSSLFEYQDLQYEDIETIEKHSKEVFYKVRLTQNKFRQKLLNQQKVCQICGIDIPELLIASHIKPWAVSESNEKVDENNGLLLCANHDKLFDRKLIAFNSKGEIIISPLIPEHLYSKLNISPNTTITISNLSEPYFKFHRNLLLKD